MTLENDIYTTQHFNPTTDHRMVCPCCGKGGLSIPLLMFLELARMNFKAPVVITSGARCKLHNAAVGGSKRSEHIITAEEPLADAADFYVEGVSVQEVYLWAKGLPFANLLGIGKYKGRLHVDTRGYAARW